MASSRLEKIGTIYSRTVGLLKAGAMKVEDRPLWLDVYERFPPHKEPKFSQPLPNMPIRNIFYAEDAIRAKFHKDNSKSLGTINLTDDTKKSATQLFIEIYNKLKSEGAISDEQIYIAASEMVRDEIAGQREARQQYEQAPDKPQSLSESFTQALKQDSVNIKDIFKE